MEMKNIKGYECIEEREVPDLESVGYLLRHKKSGARVMVLSNEDSNKVFSIGFRTPPSDSTGVPHIMEHSVLCGSREFPTKDPFVELVKGSLNTFLNAMTYPDKTVYPVASCNLQDFKNLMHVYMDAVFYPNIYQRKQIFMQEGWHYELESAEDTLQYNGVVYNEMKGAFSSPEDMLDRETYNSLYPDTPYAKESGGDPEDIPSLTYEQFLDFHRKYYHPSNSYIYLYGDCDMEERLNWLDESYLSHFDQVLVDSSIPLQKPFEKTVELTQSYSVTEEEPLEDHTYLAYNCVIDKSTDRNLYLAFQILEYSLLLAPGAPLKQTLLDRKIGKDILSTYENGIFQPYFSVIAKNANVEDKEAFLNTIREVLEEIVKNGMNQKALEAGINYYEFKYREADFGSYPKGLMYGLQAYDSWLYDETEPFMHICANETFAFLKEQINKGYFEKLIEKYLLQNPHSSVVIVVPEKGLTGKKDKILADSLKAYKESLSSNEIEELIKNTRELKKYQEEPSTQEELKTIPMLEIKDIETKAEPLINESVSKNGISYLFHETYTNGIGYLKILFDMKKVPDDLLPYAGLLKTILGLVNTKNYSYGDLFNEINRNSGGISWGVSSYPNIKRLDEYLATFEVSAKMLQEKTGFVFDMIKEMVLTSCLDDEKRLREILAMLKSRMQMSLVSSGHATAVSRALSNCSEINYFSEVVSGISFYRFVEDIDLHFEDRKTVLIQNLKEVSSYIFCRDLMMIDFTGSKEFFEEIQKSAIGILDALEQSKGPDVKRDFHLTHENEGFKTASQVQYVAMAGNFRKAGLQYNGALKVLRVIMGYDYLWNQIRVQGGAYGAMNSFSRIGDGYFASYRDPNLQKTIDVYQKAAEYVRNYSVEPRDMTKYIIGTISDMDTPLTPKAKGSRSLVAYLGNCQIEDIQKERDEVLSANEESIRALAPLVEAVISQDHLCVIGKEDAIKENQGLFNKIENLFL